jgi:WD40-like Beta Propeller Repeat
MSNSGDPKWTAFVLGELEIAERVSIRETLEQDSAALENVEQIREVSALIQESLEESSPMELTAAQRASILANPIAPRMRWHGTSRLWVAAAAVAVFLAVGLTVLRKGPAETPPSPAGTSQAKPSPQAVPNLSQKAQVESQRGAAPAIPGQRPIVLLDRAGKIVSQIGSPGIYHGFHLSPDGRRLAVDRESDTGTREIWMFDMERATTARLSFSGGMTPVWSPDGRWIAFTRPGGRLFRVASDGTGPPLVLADAAQPVVTNWSPDGAAILFQQRVAGGTWSLWTEPAEGGLPVALQSTPFNTQDAHFSPDGRFVAYTSDESGRQQVFVLELPEGRGKWQVSTGGGSSPRWRRDGREIFYLAPGARLMSSNIDAAGAAFTVGAPRMLFQVPAADAGPFEVTADGQQFIMLGEIR